MTITQARDNGGSLWRIYQSAAEDSAQWRQDEQAERLYLAALQEAEYFGPSDPRLRITLEGLINLYGHRTDATAPMEQMCWRLLVLQESLLGPDHPDLSNSISRLAMACAVRGMPAEAEALYRRRIEIIERAAGPESPDVADALIDLALHLEGSNRNADEEALWRRAIAIVEQAQGSDGSEVLPLLTGLAKVYCAQGRYDEAVPLLQRALIIADGADVGRRIHVTDLVERLADAFVAQGDYQAAEPWLRRALADVEGWYRDQPPESTDDASGVFRRTLERQRVDEHQMDLLRTLARVIRALGREAEASGLDASATALQATVDERSKQLGQVNAIASGETPLTEAGRSLRDSALN